MVDISDIAAIGTWQVYYKVKASVLIFYFIQTQVGVDDCQTFQPERLCLREKPLNAGGGVEVGHLKIQPCVMTEKRSRSASIKVYTQIQHVYIYYTLAYKYLVILIEKVGTNVHSGM